MAEGPDRHPSNAGAGPACDVANIAPSDIQPSPRPQAKRSATALAANTIVVLPTYNERENLPKLLPLLVAFEPLRELVMDDDSPDGTASVAQEFVASHPGRVALVTRTGPRSLARSLAEGMLRAIETDATAIVQMDADLSHDPAQLPAMVAATAQADVAIGSRYLNGITVVNWPLRRILLSVVANNYVRMILRMPIHDCTSGYRCWRRDALAKLPLASIFSEGYAFEVEILYLARRAGCRMVEVPIVFTDRQCGQSKMSMRGIAESVVLPWALPWRTR
jgi:dolichol-phosphate mannosyltransferase